MARTIQHKRGLEKNLPTLKPGELALTTDTKKVFVGTDNGNVEVTGGTDAETKQKVEQVTTLLADTTLGINSNFLEMLNQGKIKKIKLIGDSITAGATVEGYYTDPNGREILTRNGVLERELGKDWNLFPSWANLFRKFITTNYPSIDFFNAGVGGMSTIRVIDTHLNELVKNDEDVVFVMLGTNDRSLSTLNEYKANIEYLLDYIDQRSNLMIVMSPSPSPSDFADMSYTNYKPEYKFGAKEIDKVLTDVCKNKGYFFISHYRGILDYASKMRVELNLLLQPDGSHPVNKGHMVMWQTIQQKLGFINDIKEWFGNAEPTTLTPDSILPDLSVDKFPLGESYSVFLVSHAKAGNLPEGKAGTLRTTKIRKANEGFTHQTYTIFGETGMFIRSYNETSKQWMDWTRLGFRGGTSRTTVSTPADYKTGITYEYLTNSRGAELNMPDGKGGTLVTMIIKEPVDAWSKQFYIIYDSNRVFVRSFKSGNWGPWAFLGDDITESKNGVVASTPLSSYAPGRKTYHIIDAANTEFANFPGIGVLETFSPHTTYIGWGYQIFHVQKSNNTFKRTWNGSAWSDWAKISAI